MFSIVSDTTLCQILQGVLLDNSQKWSAPVNETNLHYLPSRIIVGYQSLIVVKVCQPPGCVAHNGESPVK